MGDLQAMTLTGQETTLRAAAVEAFQQSLRGQLITPDDARYTEARQVWNGNIDRRPGLVCRPVGVADVRSAVNFARDHHLLVSVRGGAHSFPGTCVCNGGLVIDLSLMKGIRVDPVQCTVRAEGGVTWGEFDHETQAFGLATTGGTASDTGIIVIIPSLFLRFCLYTILPTPPVSISEPHSPMCQRREPGGLCLTGIWSGDTSVRSTNNGKETKLSSR
jgi:FAD/FMN-containing dehydrogenase